MVKFVYRSPFKQRIDQIYQSASRTNALQDNLHCHSLTSMVEIYDCYLNISNEFRTTVLYLLILDVIPEEAFAL